MRAGLAAPPRWLSPKYLYDEVGSRLYEEITGLEEYYPFRTEQGILHRYAGDFVEASCSEVVVEFGSGAASKTRILLDALKDRGLLQGYGAVEVSETALRESLGRLALSYPEVELEGVLADFNKPVPLPFEGRRRLILFLGSTIGNLPPSEARRFLADVRAEMTPRDRLLVGFDLVKDVDVIERAYNDARGVTAAFNLNLLTRLNRELRADFDVGAFTHRAFFRPGPDQIEMHLVAGSRQRVHMGEAGFAFTMEPGESIRSEISRKFTPAGVEALARGVGLELIRWTTDPRHYFGVALLRRPAEEERTEV